MQFHNSCVFKYLSSGIGMLYVILRESQTDTIIFDNNYSDGNTWVKATVDLGHVAVPFKVNNLISDHRFAFVS